MLSVTKDCIDGLNRIKLHFMLTGNDNTEENITAILSQKTAVH